MARFVVEEKDMDGWKEWRNHVLKELERQNRAENAIEKRLHNIEIELAMLRTKASMWGAIGGAVVTALIAPVVTIILTKI